VQHFGDLGVDCGLHKNHNHNIKILRCN